MFWSLLIHVKRHLFNAFVFTFNELSWRTTNMLTLTLSRNQVIAICCKKIQLSFFLPEKLSETGAEAEKGQNSLGYGHKILMPAGLYFGQITKPNSYYD